MGSPVRIRFDQGLVTARDRADLRLGEMQVATGGFYKVGDPARIHKIGGRANSGSTTPNSATGTGTEVKGLYLAQFDTGGTDLLLALSGTAIYRKNPTAGAGNWGTTLVTGLSSAATNLSGVHYNNRHYFCDGQDLNLVLESDGTTRTMGMQPPNVAPIAGVSTVALVQARANTADAVTDYTLAEDWQNVAGAIDADPETFSYVTVGKADIFATAKEQVWNFTASDTNAGRRLEVVYRVTTGHLRGNLGEDIGSGGGRKGRFRVRAIITYTTDGSTYANTLVNAVLERSMNGPMTLQVPISVNSNLVKVKCSLTWLSKGDPVQLQIADVRIARGGAAANITPTTGFYYAYTELDFERNQESTASPVSLIVGTGSTFNLVTVTLPSAAQNSRATHWRIYRTPDGGTAPSQLGLIAEIPIAQTTYADGFTIAFDFQASPIIRLLTTQAAGGTLYIPFDAPPPTCKVFFTHRGRLLGIPATSDRSLAYSEPGFPESWPEINADSDFPLKESDRLVTAVSLGDTIVAFCTNTVVTLLDVPSWTDGTFRTTPKSTLANAPGCVGQDAVTTFTTGGGMLAAWVSRVGIYVTDGHSARRISDDQNWGAQATNTNSQVLHWDTNRQCLVYSYDSTGSGANDRFMLIHMAPEHQKENGLPLWTGPHYGAVASAASGFVSGIHRIWGGNFTGEIFVEDSGTTDVDQTYSSTQVPLILLTGRLYGDTLAPALSWRDWGAYKARLRHTAAGGAETVSVQWTTGRDGTGTTQVVTKTPSIVSQQANEFYVGLGGEWAEVQLTHTGAASWGILDLTADAQAMGRSGRVA